MRTRSLQVPDWLRPTLDSLKEKEVHGTFEGYRAWREKYKGKQATTTDELLRHLRRLENHPRQPVQLHGRVDGIILSFYLHQVHAEEVEKRKATARINDHKAIRSWGSYLGIDPSVWPTEPTVEWSPKEIARSPDDIYRVIHHRYIDHRRYEAALLKGLLVVGFFIGPRAPSELHALRIDDFDAKYHELTVRQPKKGGRENRLPIEPQWICCSRRHPSIVNYVHARAKVDTGESDAFFLQPDGSPFTSKATLADFLTDNIKPVFPWFQPKMMRPWCATARLIEWDYDYVRVADWLGHSTVEKLRKHYDRLARLAERRHGKGWLIRAARLPARPRSQDADRSRSDARPPRRLLLRSIREKRNGPAQI